MRLRTVEELSDLIAADLAWRKKELIAIETLVTSRKGTQFEEPLLRGALATLYAHWEGFVKTAGDGYLIYVARRRLRYQELAPAFIAQWMHHKLREPGGSFAPFLEVARLLTRDSHEVSAIPWRSGVETRANLSSGVLKEVLDSLGLDYGVYRTKEKLLDERLVRPRNDSAHGRQLFITPDDYVELHHEVIALMDLFRNQVENAAVLGEYRQPPSGTPT